ncbi:MAG: hypothetical protein ACRDSJ_19545 [Rubrobacteraceae bacterium]
MITGHVTLDGREAIIPLDIIGRDGQIHRIEAVLDTGFTGYLTLPTDVAGSPGLPRRGSETFVLADGS